MKNHGGRHAAKIAVQEGVPAATQKRNFEQLLSLIVSEQIGAFGFESWGPE
jgi:hypothetical protein